MQIIFNGTDTEKSDLITALQHNCGCAFGPFGMRMSTCAAHVMLITDQRALNGLIDGRRRSAELILQEFLLPTDKKDVPP